MIVSENCNICSTPIFYKVENFSQSFCLMIKLEGLNIGQSIKLTTARGMIDAAEKDNRVSNKTKFIESSSGNLGVALSMICKERGYPFTCVVDPNVLAENQRLMELYGAQVVKVVAKDRNGGYLESRINYIKKLITENEHYLWLNQYSNISNQNAHFEKTALEVYNEIPHVDYLFIGVSTTGTLMGCSQFFKKYSPHTKIIAVDLAGSVIFQEHPLQRFVPGIGASRKPELLDENFIDDKVIVEELSAIYMCHRLFDSHNLLLGGSSGAVIAAIEKYSPKISKNSTVVAISADFGHKYIDTIYNKSWVKEKYAKPIST